MTTDVLTGFMSGCRICSWTEGGHRRVGHIGTVSLAAADQPPNTTVKTAFSNSPAGQAGSHLKGYNPALAWNFDEISKVTKESKNPGSLAPKILSLVTATNDFYSILMMQKMGTNDWVCGGKKKIPGRNRTTILAELA